MLSLDQVYCVQMINCHAEAGIVASPGLLSIVFLVFSVPSHASVREDQRACQFGYWKTLKKGAPPPRTDNAEEQYCTGLAYWFQPSPLRRDPASAAPWYDAAAKQGHVGAMVALGINTRRATEWCRRRKGI